MYDADIKHTNQSLEKKLQKLYSLSKGGKISRSFTQPYIDLLKALGNPQEHLPPIIHVGGTNGKGSIIAILHAILEAAGYSVHRYTSPHLKRFNERIILDGEHISDSALEDLIDDTLRANKNQPTTFFEITTAMAFKAFSDTSADIVLLEVGLGGRLDCTNIISKPNVSIINCISYDHTEFLGERLIEIINEKSGIIKNDTPCISGYQPNNETANLAKRHLTKKAKNLHAPLFCANEHWSCTPYDTGMKFTWMDDKRIYPAPNLCGAHQIQNAGAALAALKTIENTFPITDSCIGSGLRNIQWPGRMQKITTGPLIKILPDNFELWFDGGHNDSAGQAIGSQLQKWDQEGSSDATKKAHLILGMKADKHPEEFLRPIMPHIASLTHIPLQGVGAYITEAHITELLCPFHIPISRAETIAQAIQNIAEYALSDSTKTRILICGSLYLGEQILE